jgi:hypothetical protein
MFNRSGFGANPLCTPDTPDRNNKNLSRSGGCADTKTGGPGWTYTAGGCCIDADTPPKIINYNKTALTGPKETPSQQPKVNKNLIDITTLPVWLQELTNRYSNKSTFSYNKNYTWVLILMVICLFLFFKKNNGKW